jgi:hypothetical protein
MGNVPMDGIAGTHNRGPLIGRPARKAGALKPGALLIKAPAGKVSEIISMRSVLVWVGSFIAVAVVVVAAIHFSGNLVPGSTPAKQSPWIAATPPPDKRSNARFSLRKDFGPWRLTCNRQAGAPRVGVIQNLGIVEDQPAPFKPLPCQVFILMRNTAAPGQTMLLSFRYRADLPKPEVSVAYITLGKPNVIYNETGEIIDLDKKQKQKQRGGFFMGQFASRNPGYEETKAQDVHLQLPRRELALSTKFCMHGHCRAASRDADVAGIGPGSKIVVRLPGPPHGQPRVVDVPSQGLDSALAELRRVSRS